MIIKKVGTHTDGQFIQGFALRRVLDDIIKMQGLNDLFISEFISEEDRERVFKILKIQALSLINEGTLVNRMHTQFQTLDESRKIEIKINITAEAKCDSQKGTHLRENALISR